MECLLQSLFCGSQSELLRESEKKTGQIKFMYIKQYEVANHACNREVFTDTKFATNPQGSQLEEDMRHTLRRERYSKA